jgi:hypothetical protein
VKIMESDLDLLTTLLLNPSLTLDEARRDAAAATASRDAKTSPVAPRRTPRELAADRFARMLDCCG